MNFPKRKNIAYIFLIGITNFSLTTAKADDFIKNDEWKFHIAPYLWAPKSSGLMKSDSGPLSEPLSETWKNSKISTFVNGSARKGRYVFLADLGQSSIKENIDLPYSIKGKLKVDQKYFTLTGGYNFPLTKKNSIDAMGGFRLWKLKGTIDADSFGVHKHINKSFASTMLSLNWNHYYNEKITSVLYFDYGGIISKTNETYQAVALASYKISDHTKISLGYRILKVDYKEEGKKLNIKQKGPFFSALFTF